jgi:hypothetical protein
MGGVGALIRSVVAGACNGSKIISGMVGYAWYNMGTDWAHEKLPEVKSANHLMCICKAFYARVLSSFEQHNTFKSALPDAQRQLLVAESSTVLEIQSELLLSQARTARHSSRQSLL